MKRARLITGPAVYLLAPSHGRKQSTCKDLRLPIVAPELVRTLVSRILSAVVAAARSIHLGPPDPGGGIVTLTVIGDCNWKLISVSV